MRVAARQVSDKQNGRYRCKHCAGNTLYNASHVAKHMEKCHKITFEIATAERTKVIQAKPASLRAQSTKSICPRSALGPYATELPRSAFNSPQSWIAIFSWAR